MKESRLEKLAPLTGVVAAVLILVPGALVISLEYLPPPEKILEFVEDNSTRSLVAGYLGLISSAFLVWFGGSVRNTLRKVEEGTGRLSNIAFGGAVGAAVLVTLAFTAVIGAATRAGAPSGIDVVQATMLMDLFGQLTGTATPFMMAVFLGATAVVSLRANLFPAWFGWLTAFLAFGLVTPINYIFVAFALVWMAVVGIWLYLRERSPADAV